MQTRAFDIIVIGAGVVGLAVARVLLQRNPYARIAVLDKEPEAGRHASGRNSGVVHCGIYYAPNTLKAKVCVEGARRMLAFAEAEHIPYRQGGKVILGVEEQDAGAIERLLSNAAASGIPAERIDSKRLRELEPFAAPTGAAIHCPTTAVIDSRAVLSRLKEKLVENNVEFHMPCTFEGLAGPGRIQTSAGQFSYGFLFNCAGAYADVVAHSYGLGQEYAFVPFKGMYWRLRDEASSKVRSNIYPVPDPAMPFLGVHLTRVVSGDVYAGPTAIPAFGRENYGIVQGLNMVESATIGYRVARMYLRNRNNFRALAHAEMGKYLKPRFLAATQKLLPSLTSEDLVPSQKVGIRPQLVHKAKGTLEMDYVLLRGERELHVLNAISPAFTGAFVFAEMIADQASL